jgi:hypothetical protein
MTVSILARKISSALRNFYGIKNAEDKYENGTPVMLED